MGNSFFIVYFLFLNGFLFIWTKKIYKVLHDKETNTNWIISFLSLFFYYFEPKISCISEKKVKKQNKRIGRIVGSLTIHFSKISLTFLNQSYTIQEMISRVFFSLFFVWKIEIFCYQFWNLRNLICSKELYRWKKAVN